MVHVEIMDSDLKWLRKSGPKTSPGLVGSLLAVGLLTSCAFHLYIAAGWTSFTNLSFPQILAAWANGTDPESLHSGYYIKAIGQLDQAFFLFAGTILLSILWWNQVQLWQRKARLLAFVESHRDKSADD